MNQEVRKEAIVYPDSNKVGKFNVLYEVLRNGAEAPMLKALFGLCVILDVNDHESGRGRTFTAASELFQPLREGEEIPSYRIEFAKKDVPLPREEDERRRINNGDFGFTAIRQNIVRVPALNINIKAGIPH